MSDKKLPELTLFSYFRSSSAWRVRIALALKGLEYKYEAVPLLKNVQTSPEYKEMNPMGQVPCLVVKDLETGVITPLSQSFSILEYLDALVSTPETLCFDTNPLIKAQQSAIAMDIVSGIQPIQNLCVLKHVQKITGEEAQKKAWAQKFISEGLVALEEKIAKVYTGTFAFGDKVSAIDMCLIPQLYNARRFEIDLEQFPTLLKVEAHCKTLPYFIAAEPDQQPDAGCI